MKFLSKNIWKIVSIFIAAGLILMITGWVSGASRHIYIDKYGVHTVDDKEFRITELDLENFTDIDVNVSYSEIELIEADKYGIDISYYTEDQVPEWSVENSKLKIYYRSKNNLTFFNINLDINSNFNKSSVKIYLPKGAELGDVVAKTSSGDIRVGGLKAVNTDVRSSYGDIDINNIESGTMQINLSSGSFKGENLSSENIVYKNNYGNTVFEAVTAKSLSANVSAGDFTVRDCEVEDINVKNSYGEIVVNRLIALNTNISASSGDIMLDGDFSGETKLHSSYGDVKFTTSKEKEYYSYDISTSFGDINIDDEKIRGSKSAKGGNDAENSLIIKCSSGDIEVNFKK